MRKLLLALPLVAGVSWAGTTYYSGSQTQPAYERLLEQLNQLKPFTVVSEEYNAGFVKSTAITKVMGSSAADAKVLFRLKHVIDHSPVGVDAAGTRVGANSVVTTLLIDTMPQEVVDGFRGQEPLVLHTRVNLSGNTINELNIASFTLQKDGRVFEFGGGNYQITSEATGRLTGDGLLQALHIKDEKDVEIDMAPSSLKFDLQMFSMSLYTGSYSMDFPSVTVSVPDPGVDVEIRDIQLSTDSDIKDGLYNAYVALTINELTAPVPINSADWRFEMRNISVAGLEKYAQTARTVVSLDTADDPSAVRSSLKDALKVLITPGVGLTNNLSVTNEGGTIALNAALDFKGDGAPGGTDNLQTVRDLVQALTARVQLDADVDAINMTPLAMLMGHPLASQYIVDDGVKYTSDIKVADLILDANGDPQSLEMMLGGMLDMPLDFLDAMR